MRLNPSLWKSSVYVRKENPKKRYFHISKCPDVSGEREDLEAKSQAKRPWMVSCRALPGGTWLTPLLTTSCSSSWPSHKQPRGWRHVSIRCTLHCYTCTLQHPPHFSPANDAGTATGDQQLHNSEHNGGWVRDVRDGRVTWGPRKETSDTEGALPPSASNGWLGAPTPTPTRKVATCLLTSATETYCCNALWYAAILIISCSYWFLIFNCLCPLLTTHVCWTWSWLVRCRLQCTCGPVYLCARYKVRAKLKALLGEHSLLNENVNKRR